MCSPEAGWWGERGGRGKEIDGGRREKRRMGWKRMRWGGRKAWRE